MDISLIYARSLNYCIGKGGGLPWHLPDESRFFSETTRAKPVIMGRKTYEDHTSLLPGRMNIVVSRSSDYEVIEGIHLRGSLDEAVALAGATAEEAFVIGGVQMFIEAMPLATRVYETVVEVTVEGDVFLPRFDFDAWQSRQLHRHRPDGRHRFGYSICLHQRPPRGRQRRRD